MTMTLLVLETMASVQRNKTAAVVPQPLKDSDEHINTALDCKTRICFKLIPVLNNELKVKCCQIQVKRAMTDASQH